MLLKESHITSGLVKLYVLTLVHFWELIKWSISILKWELICDPFLLKETHCTFLGVTLCISYWGYVMVSTTISFGYMALAMLLVTKLQSIDFCFLVLNRNKSPTCSTGCSMIFRTFLGHVNKFACFRETMNGK